MVNISLSEVVNFNNIRLAASSLPSGYTTHPTTYKMQVLGTQDGGEASFDRLTARVFAPFLFLSEGRMTVVWSLIFGHGHELWQWSPLEGKERGTIICRAYWQWRRVSLWFTWREHVNGGMEVNPSRGRIKNELVNSHHNLLPFSLGRMNTTVIVYGWTVEQKRLSSIG